ncbi:hypothetical protein CL619_05015 [archaeon]|nr:hypothetical protein [archaeon]|tara:strand:+ start:1991 stop:2692 length:702 start_codon:yes stop_codon:yes gene_type:complete
MNILKINKKGWDTIGKKAAPPTITEKIFKQQVEEFCSLLPKKAKILDLGCGPGLPYTKEFVRRGFEVTGVDISETMIKLASKNVPEAKYVCQSMTQITFTKEFDGVFASYSMLCLTPGLFEKTARKIAKALKQKGLFSLGLNEAGPKGHNESEDITEIMGQEIYSRPYSEKEIKDIFLPLKMKIISVNRQTIHSEEYGEEYSLVILMQKQQLLKTKTETKKSYDKSKNHLLEC